MLEVINAGPTELPHGVSGTDNNILLNCWGKSSPLIKELERTVNFAERKCGDLMQQLSYYKEYYEKWSQSERSSCVSQKKKTKKCCRQVTDFGSSSENEFEKVNQYFYERIKSKIAEMNNEITEANRKLAAKTEIPSIRQPVEDNTEEKCNEQVDNKTSKSEPLMVMSKSEELPDVDTGQNSDFQVAEKHSSKSFFTKKKKEPVVTRKKYSNLQRFKIRSKSLPQGVRRKFGFGGFFEVFDPDHKNDEDDKRSKSKTSLRSCKSGKSRKSGKSGKSEGKSRTRVVEFQSGFSNKNKKADSKTTKSLHCSRSKSKLGDRAKLHSALKNSTANEASNKISQPKFYTPKKIENDNSCQAVIVSNGNIDNIPDFNLQQNFSQIIAKPNTLLPFLRRPIPFIPCSSTSKSFNLGLNVQQVLSLIKHKRHSGTFQALIKKGMNVVPSEPEKSEQTINTLFFTQTTTRHSTSVCPAREGSEDCFSIMTGTIESPSKCSILREIQSIKSKNEVETNIKKWEMESHMTTEHTGKIRTERPEDVWVVEQPDDNPGEFKRIHTRCTCFPSKHCVDYHKLLRQYTGWRLPVAKTERFTPEGYDNPMITCSKSNMSNLYSVPSKPEMDDGKLELTKVYNDLLNLNRKYSLLQDRITQNNLDDYEANAELDAMESELAVREVEFKDILNFYNQLMVLKEKLKSLRLKNGQQCTNPKPKKDPLRPTPSMALTKVLRKIQGLQDKIKLIDAP